MGKIFISTASFAKYNSTPLDSLKGAGLKVFLNNYGRKLRKDEIKELIADVDGLIAGTEPLTQDVINRAKRLRVISRCGTGIDNIDIGAAERKGIKVFRTPESPAIAVAELTLGFMLNSLRHISYMDRAIRSGKWEQKMGGLLTGKTVGIIGMGYVGKHLTKLLRPFSCRIIAVDVSRDTEFAQHNSITYLTLEEVLNEADVVSTHLPLTEKTRELFNKRAFSQMKYGAIFINTSRGEIVSEDSLCKALKNGRIGYACLDVFRKEPYTGKLKELDNVTLTCHVGSSAKEARVKMEIEAVENLLSGLESTAKDTVTPGI